MAIPQAPTHDVRPAPTDREGLWIVVPAYNEANRLSETLEGLSACYHNVVVVDDGSTDATAAAAQRHSVWYLYHAINCGQGAALQTGIDFALAHGAQLVVTFDADGQHRVADIEGLVEPILAGRADVVLGSRFLGSAIGLPPSRLLVLKIGVLFTRCFSRIRVTDTHNGLRAFSRAAAEQIRISLPGMAHASEILDQVRQLQLRYCEVPVTIRYTQTTLAKGQSSWNSLRVVARLFLGRLVR